MVDARDEGGEAACFAHLLDENGWVPAPVGLPAGVPCWIATAPPDPDAVRAFYGGLFGWAFAGDVATLGGRAVAGVAAPHALALPAGWTTYVAVDSVAASVAAVIAAGGRVLAEPAPIGDSGRAALVADPAGAAFGLWEPIRLVGAQAVNAPGTWNWSNLATPDPAGAVAFYGAVFGWEAAGAGDGPAMFRRPGYGDVLAARDPDLRRRHAEAGVPPGFSDAVAWLAPGAGPARWDVTFAVDEPDAAADLAAALGGTVVMPPFDADVVRMAVVRDPTGAEVTLSHYRGG